MRGGQSRQRRETERQRRNTTNMETAVMQPSIREIRESKGMKVAELAALAGVSGTVVYRMENENYPVTRIYAQRVINAVNQISGNNFTLQDFPNIEVTDDRRGRPAWKNVAKK